MKLKQYLTTIGVLWLLTIPAITPFFQPTIPHSADGLLHVYRLVALDEAIQHGVLFPRWWPSLAFGYGLPLFIFYAPLAYYPTWLLYALSDNPAIAFNLSLSLAFLMAALGSYGLLRCYVRPPSAMLGVVAYLYAPYFLLNALYRGSLPLVWAWAIIPFAFWAITRLHQRPSWLAVGVSTLLCTLALLTHNISNLLFFPTLMLYGLWLIFVTPPSAGKLANISPPDAKQVPHRGDFCTPSPTGRGRGGRGVRANLKQPKSPPAKLLNLITSVGIPMTLLPYPFALVLSAFFLLPAMIEKQFVQIERVITPPDFDYRSNFLHLSDLFARPMPANTGLINPSHSPMLGIAQVGLLVGFGILCAGIMWRRGEMGAKWSLIPFLLLILMATLSMTLPLSQPIWEAVPLLPFVQQPHRFLSLAVLLMAWLIGLLHGCLPTRWQLPLSLGGCLIIMLMALPLLYPRYADPIDSSLAGMMAYERSIGAIGTTSFGEYLPIWVRQRPTESPLEASYQTANHQTEIPRLDTAYLPPDSHVISERYDFNQATITIDSPQPMQAVFHTFYFPGWQAQVDGQPIAVTPFSERGLISLNLPAGQHTISLSFTETPLRWWANLLSTVALLGLFGLLGVGLYQLELTQLARIWERRHPCLPHFYRLENLRNSYPYLILALSMILLKIGYVDRFDTPFKHQFDGSYVAYAQENTRVNFGHVLTFLGYNLKQSTIEAGDSFDLTAYWQVRQPNTPDYSILTHLVDEAGHLYAGQDNLHPGNLPLRLWQPWLFGQDPHQLRVPYGTPPGDYWLVIGPYHPETWERLLVVEGGIAPWVDVYPIAVTVKPPRHQPTLTELAIIWPQSTQITPELIFLGATPERAMLIRQDFLRLALFWEATTTTIPDYQVQVRLRATTGEATTVIEQSQRPSHNRYPMPLWSTGERVRDNHALWIPAELATGTYQLDVRMLDEANQPVTPWVAIGALSTED